ncbi:cob(I)yrinic acid a,c-diamide adenosyltransferase [Clostridium sp. WILCCON 0269]|uniref:Cob(I)yrinic acid a,c-diamide adenosyltransferase n=1 Tax=Candidatus Clostridium eludens TaxID=3381663 RepID=A0ABW8SGK9_9CLOT
MGKLKKGFVQVYTGNGKGKTTAALGLALRAVGNNLKVYMVEFLKTSKSGEIESAKKLESNFKIYRFEKKKGFFWTLNDEEKEELKKEVEKAYEFCLKTLENNDCDILIMDEVMGTLSNRLLSVEKIIKLIDKKPDNMELVFTGRNVPKEILERADLVTEMKDIKHYMDKGVPAREGIEY